MVTSTDELQAAVGTAQTAVAALLAEDRALGEIAFREVLQHLLAGLNGVARARSPHRRPHLRAASVRRGTSTTRMRPRSSEQQPLLGISTSNPMRSRICSM